MLAANATSIDILATLGGKWFYLIIIAASPFLRQHARSGSLHSLSLLHRRSSSRGLRKRQAAVRFVGLLIDSLIVSASHPLMDWTNQLRCAAIPALERRLYYGDWYSSLSLALASGRRRGLPVTSSGRGKLFLDEPRAPFNGTRSLRAA